MTTTIRTATTMTVTMVAAADDDDDDIDDDESRGSQRSRDQRRHLVPFQLFEPTLESDVAREGAAEHPRRPPQNKLERH